MLIACSCRTTKTDKLGNTVCTHSYRHFKKVHPHGTWASGKYIGRDTLTCESEKD